MGGLFNFYVVYFCIVGVILKLRRFLALISGEGGIRSEDLLLGNARNY